MTIASCPCSFLFKCPGTGDLLLYSKLGAGSAVITLIEEPESMGRQEFLNAGVLVIQQTVGNHDSTRSTIRAYSTNAEVENQSQRPVVIGLNPRGRGRLSAD